LSFRLSLFGFDGIVDSKKFT